MSKSMLVWTVWGAMALYWVAVAGYLAYAKRAKPQVLDAGRQRLGGAWRREISRDQYAKVMILGAVLFLLTGLYLPQLAIAVLADRP